MIIEIKIKANPGNSMIRLLTGIQILRKLSKKFGFDISVKKYSPIRSNIDIIEGIVCNEVEKFLNLEDTPVYFVNPRNKKKVIVDPLSLKSPSRKTEVVLPRQIMMRYMMKAKYTSSKAGSRYDKDHATALEAAKKIQNIANTDRKFMEMIKNIEIRANIQIL